MQDLLTTIGYLLEIALAFVVLFLVVIVITKAISWASDDARRRGKSPVLVCVAVILFFPWGLVAWLIFRPENAIGLRLPGQPHR